MISDNTTEQIWKEVMLIMEQDYTTRDSVSSEDLASGKIIPNPNDDGEHPFTDAPEKQENDGTIFERVTINDIKLSVVSQNGFHTPWGSISQLFYMLPYFNRRGYHEWIDFNMLILINDRYFIVYHVHSAYDKHYIVRNDYQDIYRQKISNAIEDYLFNKDYGKLRIGKTVGLIMDEGTDLEDGTIKAYLDHSETFKHNFSP